MLPVEPRGPSDDDSKRTVFFSDVHVDPALPEKTARLLEFLERLRAERCARAYILVDLSPGDRLCLRDTSYQAMRRAIRSAPARTGFLALPLATRLRIGRAFRRQSARSVTRKASYRPKSFSIAPSAVRRLFRDGAD